MKDTYEDIRDHLFLQDEIDFELFLNSSFGPFDLGEDNIDLGPVKSTTVDLTWLQIYRGDNIICTTTLLPADSRYRGIMTGTGNEGNYVNELYDLGIRSNNNPLPYVRATYENATSPFHIVYEPTMRRSKTCMNGTMYEIDFRDYYAVRYGDGWFSEKFPSKEMASTYIPNVVGANGNVSNNGIIMLCTNFCPHWTCPKGYVHLEEVGSPDIGGNVTIRVDGKEVVGVEKYDLCHFLVNEDGLQFSRREQYDISIVVNIPDGILQLVSVIII
uniref:Uncharacterized protein n=1 Tax=Proboscia inermis TaxID=420281 RepID=A0A7S0C401_9STRA|mmetsp:Transcript_24447/g.24880  ORF Transcript_24447/g.24880 Transcript_24447/m.24880 type:complete len:272 (+) Transcript_24447:1-816(+)